MAHTCSSSYMAAPERELRWATCSDTPAASAMEFPAALSAGAWKRTTKPRRPRARAWRSVLREPPRSRVVPPFPATKSRRSRAVRPVGGASQVRAAAQRAARTAAPSVPSAPSPVRVDLPFKDAKERVIETFEGEYLRQLIARFPDHYAQAASHAGISRQHLRVLLMKHGLKENPS
jgi:hypothetical protein